MIVKNTVHRSAARRDRFGRFTKATPTSLTPFDPILNQPGNRTTTVVRAATTSRPGRPVRTDGEAGIALPRRTYAPTS